MKKPERPLSQGDYLNLSIWAIFLPKVCRKKVWSKLLLNAGRTFRGE